MKVLQDGGFLLDVDDTLLDNDQIIAELKPNLLISAWSALVICLM